MGLTEVSPLNLGCQSPAPPAVTAHPHEQLNWTPMSPTLDQRKAEVQPALGASCQPLPEVTAIDML